MEIRRRPPNPSVKVENLEYAINHIDSEPRNILERIVWQKSREVEIERQRVPLDKLQSQIESLPNTKKFVNALQNSQSTPAIIAEVKKASPSRGIIRSDFDPIYISRKYQEGGATCLSVLTDKKFFQGGFDILSQVRQEVNIPLLCKDFILYPYQLYQARASGADAVLFIMAILSDQDLQYLNKIAMYLGLDVLVEVHDSEEMRRALSLGIFKLIGINNRDLTSFKVDLSTTEMIGREFALQVNNEGILLVSESGLFDRTDLERVLKVGARAVLIGESLMRENDIKAALKNLIK